MANFRPWQVHMSKSVCLNLCDGLWLFLSTQKNVGRPQINSENLESTKLCLLYITVSQQDVISSWTSDWSYLPTGNNLGKPLFMRFFNKMKRFYNSALAKKKNKTLCLNLAKVWNITDGMTQGPNNYLHWTWHRSAKGDERVGESGQI